jgi:hypothetical protein
VGRWTKQIALGAGVVAGCGVAAAALAAGVWNRQTSRMLDDMLGSAPAAGGVYSPAELEGLPEPVARYFAFALTPGQPLIRHARIEHEGEFRSGLDAAWSPFESVQHFTVAPAGFVWDARIRMAPLVNVRVRDSYIAGRAGMLAKVASLATVVDESDVPYLNSGALHRYLLELAWLPTALLPSQGVSWEAVDDSTARASLSDSGMTLSMFVHFGPNGEIVSVEADRLRDVQRHRRGNAIRRGSGGLPEAARNDDPCERPGRLDHAGGPLGLLAGAYHRRAILRALDCTLHQGATRHMSGVGEDDDFVLRPELPFLAACGIQGDRHAAIAAGPHAEGDVAARCGRVL